LAIVPFHPKHLEHLWQPAHLIPKTNPATAFLSTRARSAARSVEQNRPSATGQRCCAEHESFDAHQKPQPRATQIQTPTAARRQACCSAIGCLVTIKERIGSLDAVRGIASVMVVLNHCYDTIPQQQIAHFESTLWSRPLGLLHNGHAAVIIFFVLSGYVLSLPYFRGTRVSYVRYLIKRFCRIYIPFAITIIMAAGLYLAIGRHVHSEASPWFNTLWPRLWPGLSALATDARN
jgi:Acyltransferase family